METIDRAVAVVGVGACLPDAPSAPAFWRNVTSGVYSIGEVDAARWDPALYWDPDPAAPEKTYSKIGGWVREWPWDPAGWRLPIVPRVAAAMDVAQQWAVACTREALLDHGWPQRAIDGARTAVILGNAMAGEKHYVTAMRIQLPEYARALAASPSFTHLDADLREALVREMTTSIHRSTPEITEDTMPGELANCMAGRIANLFDFHGPNYVVDAACASAMAAISAAIEGLVERDFDLVVTGGVDRNMGASTYVKFSKIGALSATGTRPYAAGADGFVMGEGAAIFLLKRLADAERDGDRVYAVIRGLAGASDGKGKGITAPNPVGQRLAIRRAWENAGVAPEPGTLLEGHGTSTRVGDVVEVQSLMEVFSGFALPPGSVALGSVKSNIGHLKGAAGAAGMLKAVFALAERAIPPSLHFVAPNPDIDFAGSPIAVATELRPWPAAPSGARRAGVSAFGFGGTNFHAVLEEHVPGRLAAQQRTTVSVPRAASTVSAPARGAAEPASVKAPLRGACLVAAASVDDLRAALAAVERDARAGTSPARVAPARADLTARERVAIDYGDAAELAARAHDALRALASDAPAAWRPLAARGIFRGRGPAPKVAFLYPGQGSQYVNMLSALRAREPLVGQVFDEADAVMRPLLGRALSDLVFVEAADPSAVAQAEEALKQTAVTQPAVLASDLALTRLLDAYGVRPDFVMGHSLGEYAALVAAGSLDLAHALEAVSARGREMTTLAVGDPGAMAAVLAPLAEVERLVAATEGYVVVANVNSHDQAVVGGATDAVARVVAACEAAGHSVVPLPVSHAFHTRIVAPAREPLRAALERLGLRPARLPIVANVTGELYPTGPEALPRMLDLLAEQVASPVQFVTGLETLYREGARVFVEVGPKRALTGFAEGVLGRRGDVVALYTNHPKLSDEAAFNQALCGLYAAGLGAARDDDAQARVPASRADDAGAGGLSDEQFRDLGRLVVEVIERGARSTERGRRPAAAASPVVVTGAAVGLPGSGWMFDDRSITRLVRGDQGIDVIPTRFRQAMLAKRVTRLVKREEGGPTFEAISHASEVIKLAARAGRFDLGEQYGVPAERIAALDVVTKLAIAAGLEALRDAGLPLVMRYRTTTRGGSLPVGWRLPAAMADDVGVIFASAFPGYDAFADEITRFEHDRARRELVAELGALRARLVAKGADGIALDELDRDLERLRAEVERTPYQFDRRFLFRVLPMGHSQLAELIGARGPNTHVNSACASTTQAFAIAEDWIHAGRCRRVLVVAGDDVTSDHLLEWVGTGFLATGAAATDDVVEEAALPFDRRRHGMILGMGAAGIVIESAEAARERGLAPITEVLSTVTANSAFHGTRLDLTHIESVMERLVAQAEARGLDRRAAAPETVFVSHETYTPARGGSASAEVQALRHVFGADATRIVVANTKGFTGHAMGVGIEDVLAIKSLETGLVPPVPNFREPDPELGPLNLSRGGSYPVEYALRLGAGFGSQISLSLQRRVPAPDGKRRGPEALGHAYRVYDERAWATWLTEMAGHGSAELEVAARQLRVRDAGPPARGTGEARPAPATPAAGPRTAALPAAVAAPARPMAHPAAEGSAGPTATAPAAPAAAPPPPAPTPATAADPVAEHVLDVVAQKTGYGRDMLDLDLDLEADLGIDTVKQADLFATVRTTYDIPRDPKLKLRDFPTLRHVIGFIRDRRPDLAPAPPAPAHTAAPAAPAAAPPPPAPAPATAADPVAEHVLDVVAQKTGYGRDMLDLDLDLEADLGIDTVKQADLFATVRTTYDIPRDPKLKLRDFPTLRHVIGFIRDRRPDLAPATPAPAHTAAPAAPAAAPPPPAPAPATAADPVAEHVLDVVAQKTGYGRDMLDLDLDLEADLGIDTVKQADLFATVRTTYDIPRDPKLKLRDFPTLRHVIGFIRDRRPDLAPATPAPAQTVPTAAAAPSAPVPSDDDRALLARFPRRVATTVLRPPLGWCKPTPVSLGKGARVLVAADAGGVARALVKRLEKLGCIVLLVRADASAPAVDEQLAAALAEGPLHGVYWLRACDVEPPLEELDADAWRRALAWRAKDLARVMRRLYDVIAGPETFLVCATRLGGRHGYDPAGASAPLGGAVVGFTKAYARERPDAQVKAVDFALGAKPAEVARLLVEETLRDPGCVEVGHADGLRWSVGLHVAPMPDAAPDGPFGRDGVVLVTGAAGSITSAITADLARAHGGTFYLLDRVPAPAPGDPEVTRFGSDREGLKRELFDRIKARGERATPALVERELARIERAHAARAAIDAIEAAGGTAHYRAVDLLDGAAVAAVVEELRRTHGRLDVLVHAAGLEVSRALPDKSSEEFDRVLDVKCDGWFHLLAAARGMPIGATVVFSSIAGRFGNAGQTDYSAANDLLCKLTSSLRTTRPETRGLAIDWTAWGEIGMASRGSIPEIMASAGVDLLPPSVGVPVVRRELTAGFRGELVVAGTLGRFLEERDPSGGLDPSALADATAPMVGHVTAMGVHEGVVAETRLDPTAQPFLDDHRIEGWPVLPGVMGLEGFAELATIAAPGWHVVALERVSFEAPFKLYRDEPRALWLCARLRGEGAELVADCTLVGERSLPGRDAPERVVHFRGAVRLATEPAPPTAPVEVPAERGAGIGAPAIYEIYFHGPAYRVLERVARAGEGAVGRMAADLPPDHSPAGAPLVLEPRWIELCFQTAGIWELATTGALALPRSIGRVGIHPTGKASTGPLRAVARRARSGQGFDVDAVDAAGALLVSLRDYGTSALPDAVPPETTAALAAALDGEP